MTKTVDRRKRIINAGLRVLGEYGFAGFTQPRVAKRARVSQSHLTYYYPTRSDLLKAVAEAAIEMQLEASKAIFEAKSPKAASTILSGIIVRKENTRVIMALAQASDQEPALRELLTSFADAVITRAGHLLERVGARPSDDHRYLFHAATVGMAVITLATARPDSERRAFRGMQQLITLMKGDK